MDGIKILPGELLVKKGALKLNISLPEVGLKDVSPKGSWLEEKQIQAALEARKHLIETERIGKSGALSHAEWHEDLMLAEVTQKVGGYWQYLGHNVGKRLFLNPEEALFLMEINCLLLKFNDVKVSLQQAYALMLRSKMSLMQYKVYASLSRQGYQVFRHRRQLHPQAKETENNFIVTRKDNFNMELDVTKDVDKPTSVFAEGKTMDLVDNNIDKSKSDDITSAVAETSTDIPNNTDINNPTKSKVDQTEEAELASTSLAEENLRKKEMKINKVKTSKYVQYKINKLKIRKHKTKEAVATLTDYFANIPEFINKSVVNVPVPNRRYLPEKITLRNSTYTLNIERIRTKTSAPEERSTTSNSPNDSLNTAHLRNVHHFRHPPLNTYRGNNWTEYFNFRFSTHNPIRHFNFWRPQTSLNYFHLNMTFQRPFFHPHFGQRMIMNPFLQPFVAPNFREDLNANINRGHTKKRTREVLKQEHFASIQRLATFVKNTILELRLSDHHVSKLNHLIQTYNTRYKTRLRLSDDFNIIVDENIIDTIEVDDDEEQVAKKAKKAENPNTFDEKLQRLKRIAIQLKNLEIKNEATSRHRRMFSHLLKRFNNTYSTDYYVNNHFDVINRNDLTVLSSSDNERVTETTSKTTVRKKLKNPFSILKQLSEKHTKDENGASTSTVEECPFRYNEITVNTFKKEWLPDKSDFGRAEVVSNDFTSDIIDARREEFLFDFLKIQPDKFKNWLDIKISFLQCLQETCELFHYDTRPKTAGLESLVKPEEFNDTASVLQKLSIFESHRTINEETKLAVDFDVYNRDVQNFKKTNRPLPHFRVVCIRESSELPSGADVAGLHSIYDDKVTIVFAIVGIDSISYLQVNPIDLPIYMPSNTNIV